MKGSFDAVTDGLIKIMRVFNSVENVLQLKFQLYMEDLRAKLRADSATVAVEDSVVLDLYSIIEVKQLLDILIIIFHVVSLSDI